MRPGDTLDFKGDEKALRASGAFRAGWLREGEPTPIQIARAADPERPKALANMTPDEAIDQINATIDLETLRDWARSEQRLPVMTTLSAQINAVQSR